MSETPPKAAEPSEGEGPASGEAAPERQSTPFLVLQFFVFPLAIVAVCVTVFVVFGLIASEGKGAKDYLDEVRTGSANRRWQAAFELSKVLQTRKDKALADPRFVDELVRTFSESAGDDPRVRRYLALALGRLGDRRAVPALVKAVQEAGSGGSRADPDTQVYAVWALGSIGDAQALAPLLELTHSEDAGLRKTAVHALGAFPSEEALSALRAALQDPVDDVRWNAALALARRRDSAAVPIVGEMLDRARLDTVAGMTGEQKDEVLLQAVEAAKALGDPRLGEALAHLRDHESNLKVREAARGAASEGHP